MPPADLSPQDRAVYIQKMKDSARALMGAANSTQSPEDIDKLCENLEFKKAYSKATDKADYLKRLQRVLTAMKEMVTKHQGQGTAAGQPQQPPQHGGGVPVAMQQPPMMQRAAAAPAVMPAAHHRTAAAPAAAPMAQTAAALQTTRRYPQHVQQPNVQGMPPNMQAATLQPQNLVSSAMAMHAAPHLASDQSPVLQSTMQQPPAVPMHPVISQQPQQQPPAVVNRGATLAAQPAMQQRTPISLASQPSDDMFKQMASQLILGNEPQPPQLQRQPPIMAVHGGMRQHAATPAQPPQPAALQPPQSASHAYGGMQAQHTGMAGMYGGNAQHVPHVQHMQHAQQVNQAPLNPGIGLGQVPSTPGNMMADMSAGTGYGGAQASSMQAQHVPQASGQQTAMQYQQPPQQAPQHAQHSMSRPQAGGAHVPQNHAMHVVNTGMQGAPAGVAAYNNPPHAQQQPQQQHAQLRATYFTELEKARNRFLEPMQNLLNQAGLPQKYQDMMKQYVYMLRRTPEDKEHVSSKDLQHLAGFVKKFPLWLERIQQHISRGPTMSQHAHQPQPQQPQHTQPGGMVSNDRTRPSPTLDRADTPGYTPPLPTPPTANIHQKPSPPMAIAAAASKEPLVSLPVRRPQSSKPPLLRKRKPQHTTEASADTDSLAKRHQLGSMPAMVHELACGASTQHALAGGLFCVKSAVSSVCDGSTVRDGAAAVDIEASARNDGAAALVPALVFDAAAVDDEQLRLQLQHAQQLCRAVEERLPGCHLRAGIAPQLANKLVIECHVLLKTESSTHFKTEAAGQQSSDAWMCARFVVKLVSAAAHDGMNEGGAAQDSDVALAVQSLLFDDGDVAGLLSQSQDALLLTDARIALQEAVSCGDSAPTLTGIAESWSTIVHQLAHAVACA